MAGSSCLWLPVGKRGVTALAHHHPHTPGTHSYLWLNEIDAEARRLKYDDGHDRDAACSSAYRLRPYESAGIVWL